MADLARREHVVLEHAILPPLVRYRTSDLIEIIAAGPCACGRATPRWRVVGRADDMVVIRGINVYLDAIARVINHDSQRLTGEHRVLVSRSAPITECVVKVEVRAERDVHDTGHDLEERLARELGVHVCVTLVPEGRLRRIDGKTHRLERVL